MKSKLKKIFSSTRVIILLLALLFAIVAINPSPNNTGVMIQSIQKAGPADLSGMVSPKATDSPLSREVIKAINNVNINNENDYYLLISELAPGQKVSVLTDRQIYTLDTTNSSKVNPLGLTVSNAPKTNLRKGLDLSGGTRVLLAPEEKVSNDDLLFLVDNLKQRLNVYGLSDIVVRPVSDSLVGEGNQYILVEIAGANEEEVKNLISRQGKFEAKIGNNTVFKGGNDITYVCRSSQCSGLDRRRGCQPTAEGYSCGFTFEIALSLEAAQRQADVTKNLAVVIENGEEKLNETLIFLLDDEQVNELSIAAGLKGEAATNIIISGGGSGSTREEATSNALADMKQMQTVLITGSLPVKLNVLKTDTLSPILGDEFLKNVLFIGIASILSVAFVIFLRYRKLAISIPVVVTMVSEIVLILGFASILKWNLDLAAIAGIIIAAGTGVDDQLVITDETLNSNAGKFLNWKLKLQRAFFIIMAAYFTTLVAMLPLAVAGAGLLKGFAITTIAGVTIGVFITRPAFAKIIEILLD